MKAADGQRMFTDHSRDWKSNLYVYPVISRRSRGLSIGINLNPDNHVRPPTGCEIVRSVPPVATPETAPIRRFDGCRE